MTKKQRIMLTRILISAAMTVALLFVPASGLVKLCLYLVPYLIIGYDILWSAAKRIVSGYVFDENFINGIGEDAAGQHEMQKITPSSTLERIVPGERFDKMLSKINNAIYVLINRAQALKTLGLNFSRHTEDTDAHMTAEEKAAYVKGTLLHSLPSDYTQLGNAYRNQVLSAEAGFCIYNNAMYSFVNKASISKELYYGEISTTSEGRVNLTLT